ncbi:MAG: putative phage abortive infection protein [Bacteroidales bacterium]|nr:putative phage abortive infection protein [Bacteroidales bacterium]
MKAYRPLILLLLGCILVFGLIFWGTHFFFGKSANEAGDSAGLASGLFSALAFAGVIYAIFLQREELSLQRQELKETKEEIAGQRQAAEQQNLILRTQQFESAFFQMLGLFQQIVNELTYSWEKKERMYTLNGKDVMKGEVITVEGREVFRYTFEQAKYEFPNFPLEGMRKVLEVKGIDGYTDSEVTSLFDHYFRMLYRILKYTDETPLLATPAERYQYTSILRSQLSRYELIWLYYNGLSVFGLEKLKPLLEKYSMLKNIREDQLVDNPSLPKYKPSATSSFPWNH